MIVTVGEVITNLHEQKKTCVLSFQLDGEKHLLKFCFDQGAIRHISFGEKRNEECLPLLGGFRYRRYSFIQDVSSHMPTSDLRTPDVIDKVGIIERTVDGSTDTVFGASVKVQFVEPEAVMMVQERFIEAAGPVALFLLDACLDRVGYPKGSRLSKGALTLIVRLLSEELPEKERAVFIRACAL